MSRVTQLLWAILIGWCLHASVWVTVQDLYGLEDYLKYVVSHWVDLPPIVGMFFVGVNVYLAWVLIWGPRR